jgi:hypothetical protein
MARLASSCSQVVTPLRDEADLSTVLAELGVADAFDAKAIHGIHSDLGVIIGKWFAEQERLEVEPVASALLRMARNLSEVSQLMSGLETGFRTGFEIAVTSQLARYLALEPTIGTKVHELMASFRQQSAQIGHVCMIAHADLSSQAGKRGRVPIEWYDDFTALLLKIAAKAGVEPRNTKNRITKTRSGWLIDAAMALETFFYREMRSPSKEACGKRLERSRNRLTALARQKPPPR